MSFQRALFLSTLAAGVSLFAMPAEAQFGDAVAGTLQGGWIDFDEQGRIVNDWAALGSAVFTFNDPGFNIQIDGGHDNLGMQPISVTTTDSSALTSTTVSTHARATRWRYGGDAFWRDRAGDIGLVGSGTNSSSDSTTYSVTTPFGGKAGPTKVASSSLQNNSENLGVFGEFFALPDLTFRAKGGWLVGDNGGFYGDGGLVYYLAREVALDVSFDFADLSHGQAVRDATATAEYLPVPSIPISLQLSYTHAQYRDLAAIARESDNIFAATLKIYLDGRGSSLRDYQRTGTVSWGSLPGALTPFEH